MPVEASVSVRRGEDAVITMTMATPPNGGAGTWTTALTIRKKKDVTSDLIFAVAGVTIDAVNGVFTFTIPDDQAGTLVAPNEYWYDIWRTNAGFEAMLAVGPFNVLWAVRK